MRFQSRLFSQGTFALSALGAAVALHAGNPPERLFLQQVSTHSAIVKWRGGDAVNVCFSTKIKDLSKRNWPRCVSGVETEGGHKEALLTGLAPDQTYFYSVGTGISAQQQFRTPPNSNKSPRDGNTHILIVGDSGTQTETTITGTPNHLGEAAEVLAGFKTYNAANGGEPVDLFVVLGDNAYLAGTDAQWQGAFFDIYPDILKGAPVLPTIGNHEMGYGKLLCEQLRACDALGVPIGTPVAYGGISMSADPASYDGDGDFLPDADGMPYLSIFSLPTVAESGGVASGTEQYYSVNYGNVHIVSLDSQVSARDPDQRATMKQWLEDDLASNNRDWTIVIFHHPPYSKGANHDSDTADTGNGGIDRPQWDMRNEFTPVFEEYGVDVVYSGHSHSYERSYYLRGSRAKSTANDPLLYAELDAAGQPALGREEPYEQLSPTSGGLDDRVVYTVAGSSARPTPTAGLWERHGCVTPRTCRNQPTRRAPLLQTMGLPDAVTDWRGRR